jgi:hypothetical protein
MDFKIKTFAVMFIIALVAVGLAPKIFSALKDLRSKVEKTVG